jgi:uncharacterized protein (TIGR02996 family)
MSERDAFLRAIAANVYEDTPRLAFADWLDERGEHDRAEFIRVQCELEPIRDRYEIPRAAELHAREEELGSRGTFVCDPAKSWLGEVPAGWDGWQTGATIEYRRGFPDTLALPVKTFLDFAAEVRKLHPTIRRVVLFRVNGYGERLAACPALEGLAELELACWYSDADARAIASSPHLRELQVLELWLGRVAPLRDATLCRIMGESKAWPKLRELSLLNADNQKATARKKLVATASRAAGRHIGVYRPGYPGLFPFAADFWYTFPGYLPDGRMAMADEDHTTDPPTLCVITFDKNGKQTKDVIRVPVPADVLAVPADKWYEHKDRLKQQLIDVLGFRPGFIRVRDVQFPNDQWGGLSPQWHGDVWEELYGDPDADTEASWANWPTGNGGQAWRHLRNHEWILGWDRWADRRGRVHST